MRHLISRVTPDYTIFGLPCITVARSATPAFKVAGITQYHLVFYRILGLLIKVNRCCCTIEVSHAFTSIPIRLIFDTDFALARALPLPEAFSKIFHVITGKNFMHRMSLYVKIFTLIICDVTFKDAAGPHLAIRIVAEASPRKTAIPFRFV
jgi:hypothetical protein